jgi:hypothetical protein
MALFLPRLNVYEQMFVLALDVDIFLSSLSSGETHVRVSVLDMTEICVVLRLFFLSGNLSSSVVASLETLSEFLTSFFGDQFQKLDHFLSDGF